MLFPGSQSVYMLFSLPGLLHTHTYTEFLEYIHHSASTFACNSTKRKVMETSMFFVESICLNHFGFGIKQI